ncbi:hypothetical protein ScPMuIL_010959 [Solemya velum]
MKTGRENIPKHWQTTIPCTEIIQWNESSTSCQRPQTLMTYSSTVLNSPALVPVVIIPTVLCSGVLSLTLQQYRNPSGRRLDGECCDGQHALCQTGQCDHWFDFCVTQVNGDRGQCDYGIGVIRGLRDTNEALYTQNNNVSFHFDTWPTNVSIRINVSDIDNVGRDEVDVFEMNHNQLVATMAHSSALQTMYELSGKRPLNPTKINIGVIVKCDPDYYGADCSRHCKDQDSCDGHYTCSTLLGDKQCLSGWEGPECRRPVSGENKDCGMYDVQSGFLPSTWHGQYICAGQRTEFDVDFTQDAGSTDLEATLTIGSHNISMVGAYNARFRTFPIQSQSPVGTLGSQTVRQLIMNGRQDNSTFITGIMMLDSTYCPMTAVRMSYSNRCGDHGICVRNGITAVDVTCCCDVGESVTIGAFYLGFEGDECERKTDFCKNNPCRSGATCVSYPGGFSCLNPTTTETTTTPSSTEKTTTTPTTTTRTVTTTTTTTTPTMLPTTRSKTTAAVSATRLSVTTTTG